MKRRGGARKNWVIFRARFLWSIDARGYSDHTDSTGPAPVDPVTRTGPGEEPQTLTGSEKVLEAAQKKELKIWNQGEAIVRQQVAATILDSQFMQICGKDTAHEIWEALKEVFEKRPQSRRIPSLPAAVGCTCSQPAMPPKPHPFPFIGAALT
ncbi:hypothetical protein GALMADRAFT_148625 [Galerina marginata CBS 339.88]|uniref:Uncharacterized protein n=1 Tax=Galerina marginata (strain CBS 339.88) TaxID=685588 RepID=A0A067S6J9_GALM3|nr:hypothetical protein GALMADRAFT_148625 [Galerina marginata CBS 339.88]